MTQFIQNKALKITAKNSKNNDILELTYGIIDTDVSKRWINLIDKNNDLNHSLRYNYRRNLTVNEIEEQFIEFKNNVLYINKNYDRKLTELVSIDHLRDYQYILNDLHEEYEVYGDRLDHLVKIGYFDNPTEHELFNEVWPGNIHNKVLHECFLRLNEQIHNFEAIFRTSDPSTTSICTCLVDFMPAGLHETLQPEDYLLFSSEKFWGWGYLGYNTLGKHWNSACSDNDIDVVQRNQIRPQSRFAAEYYMNFSSSDFHNSRVSLYNWWIQNNFSKIKDPCMKLEELALGFIPVTRIYCYSINREQSILINDDTDIKDWNINVWSKFDSIIDFRVINIE